MSSSTDESPVARDSCGEPDDFEPPEQSQPEQDPDDPVTGDGSEGYPVRGGGSGS